MNATKDKSLRREISAKIKTMGFFMTCAIVCYHCPGFDATYSAGNWDTRINALLEHFFYQMGFVAMSYFFAVTGYLLFSNYSIKDYPAKMKRRVFSLLIPYLLWQCIITGIDVLQQQSVFSFQDFLIRTFGLIQWPQDGALWYVYAVFLLALTSPLLLLLFKNSYTGWAATILLIIAIRARGQFSGNPYIGAVLNYGYVETILHYLPYYLVGCYCGKFMDEHTLSDTITYILSVIFVAFLLDTMTPGFFYDTTLGLLPFLGLFVLPVIPILQNRHIYSLSFLIYATHQPFLSDTYKFLHSGLFMEIPMPVSMRGVLVRVISLTLLIGLSAIIYSVLKRFCPKLLAALTGGRF